jgi:hypothetical protein
MPDSVIVLWCGVSTIIVLALALYFLPTLLRGFAICLLIVGAFVVVAHAQ